MRNLSGLNAFNAYQAKPNVYQTQPEGLDTSFRYYATPAGSGG